VWRATDPFVFDEMWHVDTFEGCIICFKGRRIVLGIQVIGVSTRTEGHDCCDAA
jgi:hypothetical protein